MGRGEGNGDEAEGVATSRSGRAGADTGETDAGESEFADDNLGSLLGALANHQRQSVVRALVEGPLPMPVPSFATYLALSAFQNTGAEDFEDFRTGVRVGLYHAHLPKLAAVGVIDYDPVLADGIIDEGPAFEMAVELLDDFCSDG